MHLRRSIAAVIYDMDGLLLDTEPFYTEASQRIAARHGKAFDWTVKSRMIGQRAQDSARVFTESLGAAMSPEEYLEARRPIPYRRQSPQARIGATLLSRPASTRNGLRYSTASSSAMTRASCTGNPLPTSSFWQRANSELKLYSAWSSRTRPWASRQPALPECP